MFLLDSDIFSNYRRQRLSRTALVERVEEAQQSNLVRLSVFTVQEVLFGATNAVNTARSRKNVDRTVEALHFLELARVELNAFQVLVLDGPTIEALRHLTDNFKRPAKTDTWIAAQALAHNLTVVTRNTRDFIGVQGLSVIDWS